MSNTLLVAGCGLEFRDGEVSGLSETSELRAQAAVDLYTHTYTHPSNPARTAIGNAFLDEDSLMYFVGGYPRLPRGVRSVPVMQREGALMRDYATEHGVPEANTRFEVGSTSTITNAINFTRSVTGLYRPDARDIAKVINPDRRVGVVASEIQMPRLISALSKIGCMEVALVPLPTDEKPRFYDKVGLAAHRAGMMIVPRGNVKALQLVDAGLERVNDTIHAAIDRKNSAIHTDAKVVS